MSIVLAATAGLLFAVGTYLVLQRKLSRISSVWACSPTGPTC
jgi:multisubunit Na+/H+ antiporter MnhC subunit